MHSALKWVLAVLGACLLSACLDVQLNGPVVGARVTIAPLDDPDDVLLVTQTDGEAGVIDRIGQARWDKAKPFTRILFLGTTEFETDTFADDRYYLVTVRGGRDVDANRDLLVDADPTPVAGELHAIMTGAQLKHPGNARVSALTEAVYQWLLPELEGLQGEQLAARLDAAARAMLSVADGDADYEAVLAWNRNNRPQANYRWQFNEINRFAAALTGAAPAAQLATMAAVVVEGDVDGDGLGNLRDPDADNDGLANAEDSHPLQRNLRGRFVDAPVRGAGFSTASSEGRTATNGSFSYLEGESVTFSIGGLVLGSAPGQPIVSPLNLVPDALVAEDPQVSNIARLLQSLDRDCSPDNGITLGASVWTAGSRLSGELPASVYDFEQAGEVASLLAASDCADGLVSAAVANANHRQGLLAEYEQLLAETGALSTLGAAGTADTLIATDGSVMNIRPAPEAVEGYALVTFSSGDSTLVLTLDAEGRPTRMFNSDGQLVLFDNHTGESVDAYREVAGDDGTESYERVALTPEAVRAYAAMKQLFLDVSAELPLRFLAGLVTEPAGGRLSLFSRAHAQLGAERSWTRIYAAVFDFALGVEDAGENGPSPAVLRLAESTIVRATRQAAAYDLDIPEREDLVLAVAREAGLCGSEGDSTGCVAQVLERLQPPIEEALAGWGDWDEEAIRDDLAENLEDEPDQPPVLRLLYPADGQAFPIGSPVLAGVECEDANTPAEELSLRWSLDGEAYLEDVSAVSDSTLSAGIYRFDIQCSDSAGNEASVAVSFRVAGTPSITGLDLPAQAVVGEVVQLSVDAVDAEGSPLVDAEFEWFSRRDGFLGSGRRLDFTPGEEGADTLRVVVISSEGVSTEASGETEVVAEQDPGAGEIARFFLKSTSEFEGRMDDAGFVRVTYQPGVYVTRVVGGAWSYFNEVDLAAGQGFWTAYNVSVNGESFLIGPGPFYATPQEALANAPEPRPYTLFEETTTTFYIEDIYYPDNVGGLLLSVYRLGPVPEGSQP